MALNLRTPGVYIVEESKFPPSVVPVETAIPAFVGYTRATQYKGESLLNRPVAVNDLLEFQEIFGMISCGIASFHETSTAKRVATYANSPNVAHLRTRA